MENDLARWRRDGRGVADRVDSTRMRLIPTLTVQAAMIRTKQDRPFGVWAAHGLRPHQGRATIFAPPWHMAHGPWPFRAVPD